MLFSGPTKNIDVRHQMGLSPCISNKTWNCVIIAIYLYQTMTVEHAMLPEVHVSRMLVPGMTYLLYNNTCHLCIVSLCGLIEPALRAGVHATSNRCRYYGMIVRLMSRHQTICFSFPLVSVSYDRNRQCNHVHKCEQVWWHPPKLTMVVCRERTVLNQCQFNIYCILLR